VTVVNICAPGAEKAELIRGHCPTCGRSRRLTALRYPWYGWRVTCLRCGDAWEDGERMERPFRRAWRKAAVRSAWRSYVRARAALASEASAA
jgi:hypothetical protein